MLYSLIPSHPSSGSPIGVVARWGATWFLFLVFWSCSGSNLDFPFRVTGSSPAVCPLACCWKCSVACSRSRKDNGYQVRASHTDTSTDFRSPGRGGVRPVLSLVLQSQHSWFLGRGSMVIYLFIYHFHQESLCLTLRIWRSRMVEL